MAGFRHNARMSFAARARQNSLVSPLLRVGQRDVPWIVGLRNTAAIALPLAIGALVGRLPLGLGISTGALVTMFADQPGPYRLRLQRMSLTSLAAGLAAFAGSMLGAWPGAMVAAVAVWGFCAAFLVAIGPYATRIGLTSMILLVILGAEPAPLPRALGVAALILAGGALQTLFAVAAWPLKRYRPERLALAGALRGLAGAARAPVAHKGAVALPPSLNDLQTLLYGQGRARGRAVEAFRVLAELAERIRVDLFALADLESGSASAELRARVVALRNAAARALTTIADALDAAAAPHADAALAEFAAAAAGLAGCVDTDPSLIARATARAEALGGELRAAVRNADRAGSRGEIRAREAELRLPLALRPANPVETLRANLRFSSPAFRHALRCGICLAIGTALSHAIPSSRGYWLPMTVAIVLRADFGATWRVGLLRTAGTLVGLFVITGLLHVSGGMDNFWGALALMAVLVFGFRELAAVHYGVAVVCLTGLVVILLSLYGVPPETAVLARATETVLGSALAVAAYFVWPTWERGRERAQLAGMLDCYREYLAAVLSGDARTCRETRIAARGARSRAQASLDRLRAEPASRINLPRAEALVAQANRCVRAAMVLEAARGDAAMPAYTELAPFAAACDAALLEAADALRATRVPRGEWPLRRLQRALAAALAQHDESIATSLTDASDRVVDAIDSVLHVLQPGAQPA